MTHGKGTPYIRDSIGPYDDDDDDDDDDHDDDDDGDANVGVK